MAIKYGIIFYKKTSNIGDDIQTYASKQFLPQVDYIIEREKLDTFVSKDMEKVKVIMNGWYFHCAENWPPTPFIEPKLISMHFTDNMKIKGWSADYHNVFNGYGKSFFENHSPIGCRDTHTQKFMDSLKIPNYFSSCLTTTLSLPGKTKKEDVIYAVDVSDEVVEFIKSHTCFKVKKLTHYMSHEDQQKSFDERMKNVEELLTKYRNAKMVVTRRLHAALPCLALNTPVLLIRYDDPNYKGRLDTFYDFVYNVSENDLLDGTVSIDFNKIKDNPVKYKKFRNELIKSCKEFVSEPLQDEKVSEKEYIEWLENTKDYQKAGLCDLIVEEHEKKEKDEELIQQAYERIERLETELNKIYASRTYQWSQKIKKTIKKQ